MERRLVVCALAAAPFGVRAHHGWSSFDTARPIYLEGRAVNVAWRNPHAELDLDVAPDLKLPTDLAQRKVPAQSASVDAAGVLKAAQVPTRKDKRWHIELAPLTRMGAWKVAEIKNGDRVAMVGYTFSGEKGEPILRVEYLWSGDTVAALRSSPA
jgi:hypothetical protein